MEWSVDRVMRMFAIFVVLFLSPEMDLSAQNPRLELGRRLKRFEHAWETASPERRVAAIAPLKEAVGSFFTLRLSEAGRQMDNAWLAVRGEEKPNALTQAMIGLQLQVSPLCAETEAAPLNLRLKPFYPSATEIPPQAIAQLKLTRSTGELLAERKCPVLQLTEGTSWDLEQLPEGDHRLSAVIRHDDATFALPPITVSRIDDLHQRLENIKDAAASLKKVTRSAEGPTFDDTLAATLRNEKRVFEDVIEGLSQEADFPILYRLTSCESLLENRSEPRGFGKQLSGSREAWLTLAKGGRAVPTRVRLPTGNGAPAPVLFVFHGAGGSENMFFETYGAGRVVREAAQRGWIVVSPRQGLIGLRLDIREMLDALEELVPLDRERVMLLGHSMGASQAVQQVRKNPGLPIAAIALGGGGRLSAADAQRSRRVAWWIGVGDQDFGMASGKQLNRSLRTSQCPVRMKVYENVEHLVIVQAAIDDAFDFLDQVLARL